MNSKEYLEEMKKIEEILLDFLDYESNVEEKHQNLKYNFDDIKIHDDQYKIKSIMYLLLHICKNHHREEGFFSKIEMILKFFKDDLQKYFSNSELFRIFKSNKRILLFLIEEKIMNFDEFIVKQIFESKYLNYQYIEYFQPEIKPFKEAEWFKNYSKSKYQLSKKLMNILNKKIKYNEDQNLIFEIPKNFYENRKIGENDDFICKLIQKDLIGEFITYINKNNYPLNSKINPSIYETNNFLLKKEEITLIEYATFFGSIQIFKYLISNNVELTPSLWNYAIHGNDAEIFQILEENHLELPQNETYEQLLKESIKCHNKDIANYIQNNYIENEKEEEISNCEITNGLKYYNFIFIQNDKINDKMFYYLCKYDYYLLVLILLSTKDIDINDTTTIHDVNIYMKFQIILLNGILIMN